MPDSSVTPDLDLTFLYEIADGSDEFVVESIDMLLQQTPEMMESIDQALQTMDWPTAAGSAHKLKPSMGFFGMLISQALLQEIELLCKAGGQEPDQIKAKYCQAKELIETNLIELARIKTEKEAGI